MNTFSVDGIPIARMDSRAAEWLKRVANENPGVVEIQCISLAGPPVVYTDSEASWPHRQPPNVRRTDQVFEARFQIRFVVSHVESLEIKGKMARDAMGCLELSNGRNTWFS